MARISIVITSANENSISRDYLKTLTFADEIILVTDKKNLRFAEIASEIASLQVFTTDEKGDAAQQDIVLSKLTSEWVLFLKTEEWVSVPLKDELLSAIGTQPFEAYKIQSKEFYLNRFLNHATENSIRLIKTEKATSSENLFTGKLKNLLLNYAAKTLQQKIKQAEKQAWCEAEAMKAQNKRIHFYHFLFHPPFQFFKNYFLKGGFFDGVPGLAHAAIDAYRGFSKYAKLILLYRSLR